jgi:hypothetical protein
MPCENIALYKNAVYFWTQINTEVLPSILLLNSVTFTALPISTYLYITYFAASLCVTLDAAACNDTKWLQAKPR